MSNVIFRQHCFIFIAGDRINNISFISRLNFMIATTLNIHISVLSKINYASQRLCKSRKKIIVMLLMKIMRDNCLFKQGFSTVKYQLDDIKCNWHCFHIRFREDENEYFVDLRKLTKYSVSCLLAMAVDRYLLKLMKHGRKSVDNNLYFTNYLLHREENDNIISWRLYWGFPTEHLKTLKL